MHASLADAVSASAQAWKLDGSPGDWVAHRSQPGCDPARGPLALSRDVVDGLPDRQNLERLLCHVTAVAHPNEAKMVERWLSEISEAGRKPGWKAALHLWCALVEPKTDESNAPAGFSTRTDLPAACTRRIEQVSLFKDLSLALGFSQS